MCDSNIFQAERIEDYEARQNIEKNSAYKALREDTPIGKIDDIVHTWDEVYQSQTSKCADALALYDRLSADLLFASNVAYEGPPTWDDEGIINTCAASKSWGKYGVYSTTEWDFSGYCQIPTRANYDLLVT